MEGLTDRETKMVLKVYKILKLCPNLEVLDLTHTRVSDDAFKEFGASDRPFKLRHLDLTGCDNITDLTLYSLSKKAYSEENHHVEIENLPIHCPLRQSLCCKRFHFLRKSEAADSINHGHQENLEVHNSDISSNCDWSYIYLDMLIESDGNLLLPCSTSLPGNISPFSPSTSHVNSDINDEQANHSPCLRINEDECICNACNFVCGNFKMSSCDESKIDSTRGLSSLKFLSLNGCYRISDNGLCALAIGQGTPNLTHLDVSGCIAISGFGLSQLSGAVNDEAEHEMVLKPTSQ
ncbi:hypothetical protein Btru_043087 [Bulinus truncatus]|nr:hypothetical protein Btru_043087 [Bulinus truncatus]